MSKAKPFKSLIPRSCDVHAILRSKKKKTKSAKEDGSVFNNDPDLYIPVIVDTHTENDPSTSRDRGSQGGRNKQSDNTLDISSDSSSGDESPPTRQLELAKAAIERKNAKKKRRKEPRELTDEQGSDNERRDNQRRDSQRKPQHKPQRKPQRDNGLENGSDNGRDNGREMSSDSERENESDSRTDDGNNQEVGFRRDKYGVLRDHTGELVEED